MTLKMGNNIKHWIIPLLKTNQLDFKSKQCTTLNEIHLGIEIHVIRNFLKQGFNEI